MYQIKLYWQLSDAELEAVYRKGVQEKVLDLVAYDVQDLGLDGFALLARRAAVFGAVYGQSQEPLAFFYLSDFRGLTAQMHFCFFRAGRPSRREIGRAVLAWCFKTFEFKCLISIPPETNWGAVKYAREMDGREMGRIPGCCYMDRLKRSVDGVMFIFDRPREDGKWAA